MTSAAQGMAFTYQGQLQNNGAPVNGSYDLASTLYATNVTGTAIGGPVTNSATAVSNGLFTVMINFGPGVFTGGSNWLDITVRTNGCATFTELTPRQQITPTPYAMYAPSAGVAVISTTANGVAAGSVTGASIASVAITAGNIASGQVVKSLNGLSDAVTLAGGANVTVTPSGQTLTTASTASGGTGMQWQTVSGTSQQASANNGYIADNAAQVDVTLPTSPNLRDIVRGAGLFLAMAAAARERVCSLTDKAAGLTRGRRLTITVAQSDFRWC